MFFFQPPTRWRPKTCRIRSKQLYLTDFWGNFRSLLCPAIHSSVFPGLRLESPPGTEVFSHYPSDYFPRGWNESIPLELLGTSAVMPVVSTKILVTYGLFLDFMGQKTAVSKEANQVCSGRQQLSMVFSFSKNTISRYFQYVFFCGSTMKMLCACRRWRR